MNPMMLFFAGFVIGVVFTALFFAIVIHLVKNGGEE